MTFGIFMQCGLWLEEWIYGRSPDSLGTGA